MFKKFNRENYSDFFCPAPWTTTCIDPEGAVVPCSIYSKTVERDTNNKPLYKNLLEDTFQDCFNSETMKNLRKGMVSGEKPSGCQTCHEVNDLKALPYREHIFQFFDSDQMLNDYNHQTGEVTNPKIQFVDMALTNQCNLKCRMCSPIFCSGLTKEMAQIDGLEYTGDNDISIKIPNSLLHSNHLGRLKLQGGEPFIDPEMINSLESLVKSGRASDIDIQINTNATLLTRKKLEILKNFKNVNILCSLDAWGPLNDYIRYPSKWNVVHKKLKLVHSFSEEHDNISFGITTVLQLFNVYHLPEMIINLYEEFDIIAHHQLLFTPHYLSIQVLPEPDKQKILNIYNEKLFNNPVFGPKTKRLKASLDFMSKKQESHRIPEFIRVTKEFDSIRQQNLIQFCPELTPIFNSSH